MVTLEELVAIARRVQALHLSGDCDAARMANGIVDLLAEAAECGIPAPTIEEGPDDGVPLIHVAEVDGFWAPDQLRSVARGFLRAADECDAMPEAELK